MKKIIIGILVLALLAGAAVLLFNMFVGDPYEDQGTRNFTMEHQIEETR